MGLSLLVANDGGHIAQLFALQPRLCFDGEVVWVTVPTDQTTSLLAGRDVVWADPAPTRDWKAAAHNATLIRRLFRERDVSMAVSTGSSLAVSALPQAALRRIPAHYVESVTRTEELSLSGRILQHVPGVALYVQWPHLANRRWSYRGSVLDGFVAERVASAPVRQAVVSVGTSSRYGFRRLVARLVEIIPADVNVLWQTGSTDVSGLSIDARPTVPSRELTEAIVTADVLIAHAGAGIALTALTAGKIPVLVPRRASRGEHVDDHQVEIADRLAARRLATVRDADHLTWDDVIASSASRAVAMEAPPPFELAQPGRG